MPLAEFVVFVVGVGKDLCMLVAPSSNLEYNEVAGKEKYFGVSPLEGAVELAEKVDCMKLSNGVNQVWVD